jgi:hypothetical protein
MSWLTTVTIACMTWLRGAFMDCQYSQPMMLEVGYCKHSVIKCSPWHAVLLWILLVFKIRIPVHFQYCASILGQEQRLVSYSSLVVGLQK